MVRPTDVCSPERVEWAGGIEVTDCEECGGEGYLASRRDSWAGPYNEYTDCKACQRRGYHAFDHGRVT